MLDRRLLRPSKRRVPPAQLELVRWLYRERVCGVQPLYTRNPNDFADVSDMLEVVAL